MQESSLRELFEGKEVSVGVIFHHKTKEIKLSVCSLEDELYTLCVKDAYCIENSKKMVRDLIREFNVMEIKTNFRPLGEELKLEGKVQYIGIEDLKEGQRRANGCRLDAYSNNYKKEKMYNFHIHLADGEVL